MKHLVISDIANVEQLFEFAFCAGARAAGCNNPELLSEAMEQSIKENAEKMKSV